MTVPPHAQPLFARWGFQPTVELPPGHCSRVFADESRVAKVPFRGEELTSGCRAAVMMDGRGGPRVFAHDPDSGVVLMERVLPGNPLSEEEMSDWDAFVLVRDKIRLLADLPVEGYPLVDEVFDDDDPLVRPMMDTQRHRVLLHGDLHHGNMLRGAGGWVAIDPKGVVGDRALEAAGFVRNPYQWLARQPDVREILARRLEWWAEELDTEPWVIWGWTYLTVRKDTDAGNPFKPVRDALVSLWPQELPQQRPGQSLTDRMRL